jgi:DNA-binding LytR/AlgR family response regulator
MPIATTFAIFNENQKSQSILSYLKENRQTFVKSPEVLQKAIKYLSAFLPAEKVENRKVRLPQSFGFMLVEERDIIYLEASGSYTQVYLKEGEMILVSKPLSEFTRVLSSDFFEKIHRSYIINLMYLKTYSRLQGGSVIMENGAELLIARRRLAPFLEKMSRMTLSF